MSCVPMVSWFESPWLGPQGATARELSLGGCWVRWQGAVVCPQASSRAPSLPVPHPEELGHLGAHVLPNTLPSGFYTDPPGNRAAVVPEGILLVPQWGCPWPGFPWP